MNAVNKSCWQVRGLSVYTAVFCVALVSGCSNSGGRNVQQSVQQQEQTGTVSSIQIINTESGGINGGAILGAVLGGVVGNQIGSGSGRKVATGAGVIGGAMAGNELNKRANGNNELYRVTVRQANGRTQQFDYQQIGDLQIGDRVRIEGSQIYQM
jgi:outer membrane lipoprotein SlyB